MNDNTEALPPLPFAELCALLPESVLWGDPLTPKLAREIVSAALAQRQQVPEARMRETLEFIAQHFSSDWPERCQSHVLAARHCLTAAPSAQAELRMIECPGCGMEFADGALHNANLELHLLKALPQSKPLQSIPDSALVAARKTLEGKSGVDFLEGWVEFVAILRAAPSAQAEPPKDIQQAMAPSRFALYARDQQAAQAEPQMVAPQDGMQFWLWKNGDHFLAFTHLYPCFTPGGDPMVLGEPVGRAVFRRSFHRSGRGNAIGPAQPELPKARSLTDELMDCVDRLGSEAKDVDPRVWDHLRVYMPAQPAAQAEPNADLRADFERECADTDKLLTALGLSPEHCRTDGGSLKLGMILEALEARDRLIRREAAQAEPQVPLTDEQIDALRIEVVYAAGLERFAKIIRATERAHGIGKQEGK